MFSKWYRVLSAVVIILASSAQVSSFECQDGALLVLEVGVADNFAEPLETVSPDANLLLFIETIWNVPLRQLDEFGLDKSMGHTFSWTPVYLLRAELEIHVRSLGGGLSHNDRLSIEFNDNYFISGGENYKWASTLANLSGTSWDYGEEATFVFDLGNLPVDLYGRTDVMAHLADGNLDIEVQDDTAVDYIVLRFCACATGVEESSWGAIKAQYRK
jgi:hypothetical protein